MNITSTATPATSSSLFISVMYGFYSFVTPFVFVLVIIMLLMYVVVYLPRWTTIGVRLCVVSLFSVLT